MAPETPEQIIMSPAPAVSSCDSDSGCALEEYLDLKPHSSSLKHMLPNNDTEEIKFVQTLLQLLPPQDCDERFCTALGEFERRELQKFSAHRRVHSMRNGVILQVTADMSDFCMRCGGKILMGDTAVCTERFEDENLRWHLKCFVCETCHLPLSQFIYFLQDRRIYCGRHHAELSRARCAACDQLIMSEKCTIAEGLCWHVEHFCCWECEIVLGGSRYVMKGGRPFCSGCFQRLHAESCEACGEAIDPDGELVMLKGQYWHTLPSCFCCSSCRTPLHRLDFMIHDDRPYCSQHCLSSGPGMHHPSKCHSNMTRASSANYSHHTHCTPWNKTIVGSNGKQITSSLYETCSLSRCQEVLPRLCLDTGREPSESWLPEHSQIVEGVEDTSCSSSDSEPEGFFLGRPIPNYSLRRGTNSLVHGESNSIKRRHRVKSCKVS
ncbi:prickle-like protein 4 isoform X1 [Bufo bufo]|uniref:prickle-like protein 4 isoform X1 n=1 Tax=Bufo bufo TaxID=8384 RepID=UPI001ABD9C91|nr:prickle-like protein 4 isoform X1 [Bufo bufo]